MSATPQVLQEVEHYIRSRRGRITLSDLVAATGRSLDQIQEAFYTLLERYECTVETDPNSGNVIFAFRYPLRRRSAKSLREILSAVATTLWSWFVRIYKIAIGLILIIYTIIFILILLALILGGSSRSDDRERHSSTSFDITVPLRLLFEIFYHSYATHPVVWVEDDSGFKYPTYQGKDKEQKKKFLQAVYDFVFGPPTPKYSPLDDAKEAAAFIYFNDGKLTCGHIVALTGIPYSNAEHRFTEYLGRFQGEPEILEDGTVVATFPRLTKSMLQSPPSESQIVPYPDEVDPPVVHNGNTTGQNIAIIAMNAFNLGMAAFMIHLSTTATDPTLASPLFQIALGYFPLIVSILYFLIPLARLPFVWQAQQRRAEEILRKRLFRVILRHRNASLSAPQLFEQARIADAERNTAEKILAKLRQDLEGEITLNADGIPLYSFPRFHTEIAVGPWLQQYAAKA